MPLSVNKIVGPSTSITYLGIKINTVTMMISLPEDKLEKLKASVSMWYDKLTCTKRELLSLIGFLSFACKVVKPGRIFLRRLIDLSTTVENLNSIIALDEEAKLDIRWWMDFISVWNGREMVITKQLTSASLGLYTDASTRGMGAVMGRKWFSTEWPLSFADKHKCFEALCCGHIYFKMG